MIYNLCRSTVCLRSKLPHILPVPKSCFNFITLFGSACVTEAEEMNQFYTGRAFLLFLFCTVKLLSRSFFNTPLFWLGLDKYQVPTKTNLSLPLLRGTGERKYDERLEGR